jgi:hypothetical protein
MEERIGGRLTDGRKRLDDAGLIVGMHDAYQRSWSVATYNAVKLNPSVCIHGQDRNVYVSTCKRLGRVKHGMMLRGTDGQPIDKTTFRTHAVQDGVVRLRTAAREDQLCRMGAQKAGDLGSCILDGDASLTSQGILRRCIAKSIAKPWQHRIDNVVIYARGSGVV